MPKLKEFFSLLKEQGKINHAKFDELIEKVPDFEIDPEAQQVFENSFFTIDRAATHQDVKRKIRLEALLPIDRDMEKIIEAIGQYDKPTADKLQSLTRDVNASGHRPPDTYKRLELLSNSLADVMSKVKAAPAGGDEELKKQLKKKTDDLHEALEKINTVDTGYKKMLADQKKTFDDQLDDFKLDVELEKIAGTFTLAEAYDKNRAAINKIILSDLKSQNKLKLGTNNGQSTVEVYDQNGSPRYDGNSPINIKQLLEVQYKPFLKQSNGSEPPKTQANPQTFTNPDQKPIQKGVSTVVK